MLGKFSQIPSHQNTSMNPPAKLKAMTQPCLLVGDITKPVCELSTGTRICNFVVCRLQPSRIHTQYEQFMRDIAKFLICYHFVHEQTYRVTHLVGKNLLLTWI